MTPVSRLPAEPDTCMDLIVKDARLAEDVEPTDLGVADGSIVAVATSIDGPSARVIDAGGALVIPPFVDPHFHLDKVLSRGLLGAFSAREAFARAREIKTRFTAADVQARACEALRLAAAHGTGMIRAQVDVDSFTGLTSLQGVLAARERYLGIVDLEIVAFPQEGILRDPQAPDFLREALSSGADLVGGLPECERTIDDQRAHLEAVFDIADAAGVPLDLHIDYMDDPALRTLEMLADLTVERGMQGRVTADHCCALAVYPDDEAKRVIEKVLAAQIRVILLPVANLQMLGGEARTPRNRGSSRMAELLDVGVPVAVGLDNMYDIWFRFGRMDPVELALVACLSGGLRTDDEVLAGFEMTNVRAAEVLGRPSPRLEVGAAADFVILGARNVVDVLRDLPGRRTLVRGGRLVAGREGSLWTAS